MPPTTYITLAKIPTEVEQQEAAKVFTELAQATKESRTIDVISMECGFLQMQGPDENGEEWTWIDRIVFRDESIAEDWFWKNKAQWKFGEEWKKIVKREDMMGVWYEPVVSVIM